MLASRTFPACKFWYDAIMSQSDTEDNSLLYCISPFFNYYEQETSGHTAAL